MEEFLTACGLNEAEVATVRIVHAVVAAIDWQCPLWKSAGFDIYERLESRVRAAAREPTVKEFASRFARKCHVPVPSYTPEVIKLMSIGKDGEMLNFARYQSGLVVASIRAFKDQAKEAKKEKK